MATARRDVGPLAASTMLVLLAGCAQPPDGGVASSLSRIHASNVPEGSLRAGQVVGLATAAEVAPGTWGREALRAGGVPENEIGAGSILLARVFCCGGQIEEVTAPAAWVPKGATVAPGDFVEIWSDRPAPADGPFAARPNRVTRVLQTASSPTRACSWQPDDPRLRMRVVYCDWMPAQGWSQQAGTAPFWVKVVGPDGP
jgi:hypothetical protein